MIRNLSGISGEIDDHHNAQRLNRESLPRDSIDMRVEVPAVGADRPHGRAHDLGYRVYEEHFIGAGVRSVQEQEAVALRPDVQVRPRLAVHHDGVADELRRPVVPDWWPRAARRRCLLRRRAGRSCRTSGPGERLARLRLHGCRFSSVGPGRVDNVVGARKSGVYVQARCAQGVVMEPDRGRSCTFGYLVERRI